MQAIPLVVEERAWAAHLGEPNAAQPLELARREELHEAQELLPEPAGLLLQVHRLTLVLQLVISLQAGPLIQETR